MKVFHWLYLFILVFALLAFGTVELWSQAMVQVLTGGATLLLLIQVCFYRREFYNIPGVTPLLLLLLFILLQLLPLPVSLVRLVAPASYGAYAPVLSVSGGEWISLTINQKATVQEFFRISSYILFYILTIQLLSTNGYLKKTIYTVIGLSAGIALIAIFQKIGWPDEIYWIEAVSEHGLPFSLYIKPNQFAGFMEMMIPLAFGLFFFYKPRVHLNESLKEKVVNFVNMPGSNLSVFVGGAATLITLSVFVSLCQDGILTIIISALVFMLLYNMKRLQYGRIWILLVVGCVPIAISWFGWDTIVAKISYGAAPSAELFNGGLSRWADSQQIIQSFFLFGSGFGTYGEIWPSVRILSGNLSGDLARNNFLEFLMDGGAVSLVLASWFVFAVLNHGWRMIRDRRDLYSVLLGIGAFSGIVAMLTHSLTGVTLHNGVDSLYFFFFCGLLVAIVNTRFEYCESRTLLKKQSSKQNICFLAGIVALTGFMLVIQYGTIRGRVEYGKIQNINVNQYLGERRLQEIIHGAAMAKRFDPIEYLYDFKLGTVQWLLNNREKSLNNFLQAAQKKPMDGPSLQRTGLLVDDEAKAMMLLENGYQRDLNNHELAVTFVEYLLGKGERERAVEVIVNRLKKAPSFLERWASFLDLSLRRDEIATVLSFSVDAWVDYGTFLGKLNKLEEAEYYFNTALTILESEEQAKPQWFQSIIQFYKKNGQPEKAILILRQAVEAVPDYAPFHIQFGDYCRKEGITFLARQEYQRALMLDPGNISAIEGLELLDR